MIPIPHYRGRFAPSPTGLLHAGSLLTAVGSYLDARSQGGEWWLRIEDLDPPREIPGAVDAILRTLDAFGLQWDGAVTYQSQRHALYQDALEQLIAQGAVYGCTCTRKMIAAQARRGIDGSIYPGTCRQRQLSGAQICVWRLAVPPGLFGWVDRVQGAYAHDVANTVGDFVLKRADGFFAYQLAVVVDDAEQAMSDVVRGADLLDSTPRQLSLLAVLGLPPPRYAHLPLVVNAVGEKLSKQTQATPLDPRQPVPQLRAALSGLGHPPPPECECLAEIWAWAHATWQLARIPAEVVHTIAAAGVQI